LETCGVYIAHEAFSCLVLSPDFVKQATLPLAFPSFVLSREFSSRPFVGVPVPLKRVFSTIGYFFGHKPLVGVDG